MTNVSRIVALRSSIHRILRVSEAPGSPNSNGPKRGSVWLWGRVGPLKETKDRRLEDRIPETRGSK